MNELALHTVNIPLADRSYSILIGTDLLSSAQAFEQLSHGGSALIVTNTTVSPLYADTLSTTLRSHFANVRVLVLPDGEHTKHWQTLNTLFDALLSHNFDRKSVLFALGGGVVGDMTGFAAACYMRGISFVQVPTTLLAQVDSSVGGKTGINHPMGKNMIGAFHQPLRVVCDLGTLKTLPPNEVSAGLAEVIKYGPIADSDFLDWIEGHMPALRLCDSDALAYAVRRSCEIKAWVVGKDERESGLRAILNFGHTFGHAIEAGLGYGSWLHGEAVGCGMVMAAHLSCALGLVDQAYVQRLTRVISSAGLPVKGPVLDVHDNAGRYMQLMRHDKKASDGEIRFVVIDGPGRAAVRGAPDDVVREVIERCCA